jgi:Ribbon-helix-helix protein, copG family
MRTTISVNDHLLASAKRRARERGLSLGQVVEDALRRELADPKEPGGSLEVPVFRGGGGPLPGIELTSNRALREALDRGVELDALR